MKAAGLYRELGKIAVTGDYMPTTMVEIPVSTRWKGPR